MPQSFDCGIFVSGPGSVAGAATPAAGCKIHGGFIVRIWWCQWLILTGVEVMGDGLLTGFPVGTVGLICALIQVG